jgi:molybdate transport system ATP-binding protein
VSLTASVSLATGSFALDAAVDVAGGETVAILGPNGAGKTTLLRALAGLLAVDAGEVRLDDTVLDDGRRVFVPPERRPIGVVFQDYLLFPHLSVLENVAFGLRSRGVGRRAARASASAWLVRAGLGERAGAKPRELSGGQAQRVALARALAPGPRLLLLDEPLAALDQSARGVVRRALRADLAGFDGMRVLVTHDPLDAAALADRLLVLEHGRVVQTGTFAEVSARPRSRYVADLVGVNLLRGTAEGTRLVLDGGGVLVLPEAASGAVLAVVHPHSVSVHRSEPSGSPRNVARGRIESIVPVGDRVRVQVGGAVPLVAEVTATAVRELELVDGAEVWVAVKATELKVFPA